MDISRFLKLLLKWERNAHSSVSECVFGGDNLINWTSPVSQDGLGTQLKSVIFGFLQCALGVSQDTGYSQRRVEKCYFFSALSSAQMK